MYGATPATESGSTNASSGSYSAPSSSSAALRRAGNSGGSNDSLSSLLVGVGGNDLEHSSYQKGTPPANDESDDEHGALLEETVVYDDYESLRMNNPSSRPNNNNGKHNWTHIQSPDEPKRNRFYSISVLILGLALCIIGSIGIASQLGQVDHTVKSDSSISNSESTITEDSTGSLQSKDEDDDKVSSEEDEDEDEEDEEDEDSNESAFDSSSFQVRRVGYNVLDYFGSDADPIKNYKFLSDYHGLVEPYAPTVVEFIGSTSFVTRNNLYYYDYDMDGTFYDSRNNPYRETLASGDGYFDAADGSPSEVTVPCEAYTDISLKITVYDTDMNEAINLRSDLVCMYVRREIRNLTSTDLDTAIKTMYQLWALNETEGQAIYGSDFHSSTWFTALHDFNAAWQDADHIHEGLGFMPQHMKMSNLFEKSMQAVDPSTSLFYWDFTIDEKEGLDIFSSPMFQENTFGELAKPADSYWGWTYRHDKIEDARVLNGLWADIAAQAIPESYSIGNSFGYMRGPWNMNPSAYVSRFTSENAVALPSCVAYYKWLQENDFSSFMWVSENAPHASTHAVIGGYYGCDMLDELKGKGLINDDDSQIFICSKWGFYIKEMYRGRYLAPRDSSKCWVGESSFLGTQCAFECDDTLAADHIDMMKNTLSLGSYVPANATDDDWNEWRDFICTGDGWRIFVGDHLESASPADPTFWPIHPSQDRLLQLKYATGGFEDFTWPTTGKTSEWICNHNECFEEDKSGNPTFLYWDDCCYGHFEHDQLLDFTTGDKSKGYGPTNSEMLLGSDPSSYNYSMPYIYDNFQWDHCTDHWYAFDDLIDTLVEQSYNRTLADESKYLSKPVKVAASSVDSSSESEDESTTSSDKSSKTKKNKKSKKSSKSKNSKSKSKSKSKSESSKDSSSSKKTKTSKKNKA